MGWWLGKGAHQITTKRKKEKKDNRCFEWQQCNHPKQFLKCLKETKRLEGSMPKFNPWGSTPNIFIINIFIYIILQLYKYIHNKALPLKNLEEIKKFSNWLLEPGLLACLRLQYFQNGLVLMFPRPPTVVGWEAVWYRLCCILPAPIDVLLLKDVWITSWHLALPGASAPSRLSRLQSWVPTAELWLLNPKS